MVGAQRTRREFSGRRPDDDERSLESQMSIQADSSKRKVSSTPKNHSATQNTTQAAISSGLGQDIVATASSMVESFDGPEGYPRIPSFHDSFRAIRRSAESIISRCQTVHAQHAEECFDSLEQSCGPGLVKVETQLQNFPDAGTIVLIGMTGKGKSSTMNSLLKQQRSAYESADTRGTFVVTYYKNAPPGQTHKFVVEVVTRYSDDMNARVDRLVRGFYGPDRDAVTEDEDEDEQAELFAATLDDEARLQTSACKTLDDVLAGSELLRGYKDSKAYLLHMQANTTQNLHATVIEQVEAAVGEVMDKILGEDRDKVCRYNCATPAEVQKVMANIARTTVVNQQPVPSIWPFVEHINVHMTNEFLATGLTLVDTPGLGDENVWVQLNTDTAMTNAGMIVLVHDHARPDNQAVLDQAIRQCVNHGKISNTIMVLTKMDEIAVPSEDDRAALSVAQLNRLEAAEQAVADSGRLFTEATHASVVVSEDDDASGGDRRAARATKDAAQESLSQARRERTACAVNIFIDKHRNLLREKVDDSNIVRKRALKVIHISNRQYFSADRDAQVSLADTGIPRLRAELWRFAHKDHLSHLKSVMRQLLLALLGIDAVLNHAPSVRKESIRPKLRDQLNDEPELSVSFFQELFNAHAAKPMLASSASYTTAMIDVIEKFPGRHKAQTIMAILKKNGVFKPRGSIDEVNWNVELCRVFSDDAFQWWNMGLACHGTAGFKKYEEAFETHFENVCLSMSELGVKNGFDPTRFNKVVKLRAQELDAEIRAIWRTFINTADALGDNLMGYRAPNLLQHALQPAYADASKIIGQRKGKGLKAGFTASTGKNVTSDRIEHLAAYVRDASHVRQGFTRTDALYNELSAQPLLPRTVMDVLRRRTEIEYLDAGDVLRAELPRICNTASAGIMADFEQRFGDDDGKDGSALSQQTLADFMAAIEDGRRMCEGELVQHMANCDKYELQDDSREDETDE